MSKFKDLGLMMAEGVKAVAKNFDFSNKDKFFISINGDMIIDVLHKRERQINIKVLYRYLKRFEIPFATMKLPEDRRVTRGLDIRLDVWAFADNSKTSVAKQDIGRIATALF